jgi:hypothetical protein
MIPDSSLDDNSSQKLKIIIAVIVAAIVVIAAGVYGYQLYQKAQPATGLHDIQELGSGFRQGKIGKLEKGQLVQYPFFFYKDRPLCQVGPSGPSISPSGNYGVCQDVRTGKIMLFRRSDEKLVPITATPFAIPSRYVWHEDEGNVEAIVGKEGFSAILSIK